MFEDFDLFPSFSEQQCNRTTVDSKINAALETVGMKIAMILYNEAYFSWFKGIGKIKSKSKVKARLKTYTNIWKDGVCKIILVRSVCYQSNSCSSYINIALSDV